MKIEISIDADTPKAGSNPYPQNGPADILEKVNDYIVAIESHEDSRREWQYLKALYNKLSKKKHLTDIENKIILVLEPCVIKHSGYDSVNEVDLIGFNMFKGDEGRLTRG